MIAGTSAGGRDSGGMMDSDRGGVQRESPAQTMAAGALKSKQVEQGAISDSRSRCARWSQGGQPGGGEMGDHSKSSHSTNKEIRAMSIQRHMKKSPRQTAE